MSDKKYSDKSIDELSIKEALSIDIGRFIISSNVMVDPAPVSVTPTVIGKKAVKGTKRIVKSIKSKINRPKN